MAKRERIKKLAKRLRVEPEVAIRTLQQLGETRYKAPADMIPDDVAVRLEQALKLAGLASEPPPPEAPVAEAAPTRSAAPGAFVPEKFVDDDAPPPAAAAPGPTVEKPSSAKPAASSDGDKLSNSPFAKLEAATPPVVEAEKAPAAPKLSPAEELKELRSEVKRLTRDLDDAVKRAGDAEDAWRSHDMGRKQATAERDDLEGRLAGVQNDLKSSKKGRDKERSEFDVKVRDLKGDVEEARTTALRELFEGRGMQHPDEFAQALSFLLEEERAGPSIRSLRVQGPDKFAQKLNTRLLLWCGDSGCKTNHPEDARVVISPPARCEKCKGKTIRRAAAAFVDACQKRKVLRVTIAGGSPNYRTAIQDAIGGGANLDIRVVLNGERNASQAQSDVDHSELVIAWVATEVDHKFTGLYTSLKSDRVLLCPHRGVSRMFEFASEHINDGHAAEAQIAPPAV